MTTKLYDNNAYETEFDAKVLSCEAQQTEEGTVYQVILDQTLFFPEEGGQSPDLGTIEGVNVSDVQIRDEVIRHTLAEPLSEGSTVHGIIDWQHRFNNMQQHTGEHMFSGLVHERFGYDNVGFHLSDNVVTMDFNGVLTAGQAAQIEYAVNEVIVRNLPVEVSFPSKEELASMEYRSKIEIDGQVRIVTIPGVDVCACCAPHVRHTGEVGMLKIMSVQSYKGGVRISILCGFRALMEYRAKMEVISAISASLSGGQEMLPELVEKQKSANQDLKRQLAEAKQKLMAVKMAEIPADQEHVLLFETELETAVVRTVVNGLTASHPGICGVFVGTDGEGYQFIIGSSTRDCRQIAALLREKCGARGGGSAQMIQGSVQMAQEKLEELLSGLAE